MADKLLDRLKIIQGADRQPIIRLKNGSNGDPFDLTGATRIAVTFNNKDRSKTTFDNVAKPAVKATYTNDSVIYSAVVVGSAGNDIILTFDGVDTIATVIATWNGANPGNTVSSNAPDDSVVPSAVSFRLTDGYDGYTPVSIVGDALLGKIQIILLEKETNLLRRGPNQSFKLVIDEGQHPGGKRSVGLFENKLDVLSED